MKHAKILIGFVCLNTACWLTAQDLAPLATNCAIIKGVIGKFIEGTTDYTAVFQYQVFDPQGATKLQMSMSTSVIKDRTRDDVYVMAMSQIPEEHRAAMKSVGLERMVFITQFDTKKMYVVFPNVALFQEIPISDAILDEVTTRATSVSLRKTQLELETVNGYSCMRTLVEVVEPNRAPEKAIVSYASDLKQFPVRILFGKGNSRHTIEFKNVQLVTPPPFAFEIPTNYTRVENTADMLRIAKERFDIKAGSISKPFQNVQSPGN